MKKQYLIMSLVVFAFLAGCQKESENTINPMQNDENEALKSGAEDPCYTLPIYGGQTIPVGSLYVAIDEDKIFVTYDLTGTDWYLEETHLYVGPEDDLPLNGGGNPKIGHFPYSSTHNGEQSYTYEFDREDFADCFTVAAHAVVVQMDENGNQTAEETAWAEGDMEFPGNRWGWYLQCAEDCETECDVAYAYNTEISTCFIDIGETYGWNIGPFDGALQPGVCIKNDLTACPTGCSGEGAIIIGKVIFATYWQPEGVGFRLAFQELEPGYQLEQTFVYVGDEPLPMINGEEINPEDFPYKHLNLNGATHDYYYFPNQGEQVYVVAYAKFSQIEE